MDLLISDMCFLITGTTIGIGLGISVKRKDVVKMWKPQIARLLDDTT
jgi:hypothetical protein